MCIRDRGDRTSIKNTDAFLDIGILLCELFLQLFYFNSSFSLEMCIRDRLLSGRYRPITLEGRNLFATRDFYAFFKHLEETGIEATHKGVVVIAMNKLREVMLETPEVLDNARLTADGRNLYLIKNKSTNIG